METNNIVYNGLKFEKIHDEWKRKRIAKDAINLRNYLEVNEMKFTICEGFLLNYLIDLCIELGEGDFNNG